MASLSRIVFWKIWKYLPFYQRFGLVCDISAPIKICCNQFSPALFFQRAYSLVGHTQNCLRFRRFFSSFTVFLLCYLWLFMVSVCKSSYQIIVVIVKNYQVNYEVRMKRERHNFCLKWLCFFSTKKLTLMDLIVNCGQVRWIDHTLCCLPLVMNNCGH